jgi:MoxR-like ATPase
MNTENVIARCWALAEAILTANRTACLHGPAGTGKTYAAQRVGLKDGAPEPITVTLTSDTSAADLMGYYISTPEGFKWNDGPALRAWRCGARLVVNEADKANGDAESALHTIADESGSAVYVTAAGETIRPSPGFHCIATTNADPTEAFRSEGVADRFSVRVHVNQPHPAAIAALPEDLRKAAASTWNADPKITMRQWRAFAELRGCMSSDTAAELVFGARASAVLDSLVVANA